MLEIILVNQKEQTRDGLIDSLVTLERNLFRGSIAWDEDDFLEYLEDKKTKLIVLTDSDDPKTVQGYCLYTQYKKKIDISSVGVSASIRGENYGFSMLKHALDSASNNPGFSITIDCMPELMGYYAKMGFEEYKEREPGYYELTDDEVEGVHMKVDKKTFDETALARSARRAPLEEMTSEKDGEMTSEKDTKPPGCF